MKSLHFASCLLIAALTACAAEHPLHVVSIAPDPNPRTLFLNAFSRTHIPLDPQTAAPTTANDFTEIRFSFASDPANRVPGILLKPKNAQGKLPVVIALHGTGGSKTAELPFLRKLVQRGFIAIAIDAPYHGERATITGHPNAYENAILHTWEIATPDRYPELNKPGYSISRLENVEHPFYYDTVWDVMRLVDYLQTRDDVDPHRIGLYGVSKGGIETYLTAAVDPRIAVAVPCIGVESFRWALDHDQWHSRIGTIQPAFDAAAKEAHIAKPDAAFVASFYNRVVPGITDIFDGPSMLPLIAPRPLLVINGDSDPRTPLEGLKLCTDAAQTAYHRLNADDHFVIRIQPHTAHKVNPDSETAAIDFFAHWLAPVSTSTAPQ